MEFGIFHLSWLPQWILYRDGLLICEMETEIHNKWLLTYLFKFMFPLSRRESFAWRPGSLPHPLLSPLTPHSLLHTAEKLYSVHNTILLESQHNYLITKGMNLCSPDNSTLLVPWNHTCNYKFMCVPISSPRRVCKDKIFLFDHEIHSLSVWHLTEKS